MKKVLIFDAFNGVSGDMVLGALLDLGLPMEQLERELRKLPVQGYRLETCRVEREGLLGVNLRVELAEKSDVAKGAGSGSVEPSPTLYSHRHFSEIRKLIQGSSLEPETRSMALRIFQRLAESEAAVHQVAVDRVHFHEVGAVDSIVDIVGAAIGFRYLQIEEFFTSALDLGSGTVTFSHGTWPVPAPATAELIKGFPVRFSNVEAELTTPTGAAIVTTLASPQPPPTLLYLRSGLGAGDKVLPGIPNMLRLHLAEKREEAASEPAPLAEDLKTETVILLEANIDDMEAELFGHFLDLALDRGALDVFFSPIQMKKNRPGVLLTVLCRPEERNQLADLFFRETTTLGVRITEHQRWSMPRQILTVETGLGPVRFKVARLRGKVLTASPEFEDLKKIAAETGLTLREIRARVADYTPGNKS